MSGSVTTSSYWCYRCSRFVRVWDENRVVCPHCDSGFIEAMETDMSASTTPESRRRFPARIDRSGSDRSLNVGFRNSRRNRGERSPFNPVIVLRRQAEGSGDEDGAERSYELYYDDGTGSGLRPLPHSMSEFLMGSGFDRLLDQLAQIEINGLNRTENPPASKLAIESMPTVEIDEAHVNSEAHCAVCKEAFVLGSEAREMPCTHIYHSDCILPWLSLRNSCPVCRHKMPTEPANCPDAENPVQPREEDEMVGLTIWRLPGGGFAVGRFSGERREGRELPVVYTEMDGGFNQGGVPMRIAWGLRRRATRDRHGGGIRRAFGNFLSFFRRFRSSSESFSIHSRTSESSTSGPSSVARSRSASGSSVFSRFLRRSNRNWEQNGVSRW